MDKYGGCSKLGLPLFDGTNYAFWSIRMKFFLQSQGLDVWMVIENRYNVPYTTSVAGTVERRLVECNAKSMYVIQGGLIGLEFVKVIHCTSVKEIWDKLKNV
jgi:hypothetical protein